MNVILQFQGGTTSDDQFTSCNSILYAEAIILPYKLVLQEDNDDDRFANVSLGESHEETDHVGQRERFEGPKPFEIPCSDVVDSSKCDCGQVKSKLYRVPCLFNFRTTDDPDSPVPGYLCCIEKTAIGNIIGKQQEERILLEFKSDSVFKYQVYLFLADSFTL